jgi:hypothetical protein
MSPAAARPLGQFHPCADGRRRGSRGTRWRGRWAWPDLGILQTVLILAGATAAIALLSPARMNLAAPAR